MTVSSSMTEEEWQILEGMRFLAVPKLESLMGVLQTVSEAAEDPTMLKAVRDVLSCYNDLTVQFKTASLQKREDLFPELQKIALCVEKLQNAPLESLGRMCDEVLYNPENTVCRNIRRLNKRLSTDAHLLKILARCSMSDPMRVSKIATRLRPIFRPDEPSYGAIHASKRKRYLSSLCDQTLSSYTPLT